MLPPKSEWKKKKKMIEKSIFVGFIQLQICMYLFIILMYH